VAAGRSDELARAHEHWDAAWRRPEGRDGWLEPEPAVLATISTLQNGVTPRVLDLGCGVGRHARAFAAAGLETHALDGAPAGIEFATAGPSSEPVRYAVASFLALPYARAAFDYVLAWNVVYHGDRDVAHRAISEVARVVRPHGIYQSTMLSKRHRSFGRGAQIRPDTWVDGADPGDKAHPHLFTDERDVHELHDPWFEVVSLHEREQRGPNSWHLELVLRRRAEPTIRS
jgi:SAM-dependent methyltransferase